jgi:hypothetical protein
MIAFIINHNRLTLPRRMADYLATIPGIDPVIVDNASTYEPLLAYYDEAPYTVERMATNMGCPVVWVSDLLDKYHLQGEYIVTDPDLIIDHIPTNFPEVLKEGLRRYPFATKSGFSLRINDLPDTKIGNAARAREAVEWHAKLDERYYKSSIDTTFALVRTRVHDFAAVRTAPPYQAIHAPWYYTSKADLPPDELYYLNSIGIDFNYWSTRIKEQLL